ncbi:hypothetical protein FRB94_005315 [Tulasnella sp. JGI-2019a]|nr:hypothetical protein FRB93_000510 [Tulasnella sp. JGI-2019a]KAG9000662.1 hypothetical protein FRB94_005315 [Tulasnella sp. JGI-2019a]KAG9029889.1 hypothetical protein FRB95_004765 [Tulasnella sp. JGI-2019a]
MEDIAGYAVACLAIYGVYRYFSATGPTANPTPPTPSLGFTPKRVTEDMVTQVQTMFPDQPYDNIKFDLLKTGSVEATCNKILEQGFVPAPSHAYYTLYPTQAPASPVARTNTTLPGASTTTSTPKPNLIQKFGLSDRIAASGTTSLESESSKRTWETTAEKREMSLKEKKAQMILAARQHMLESTKDAASGSSSV